MTPEQWQVVSELFNQVIELNPDQRLPFLEDRCKGKDDIRREVESLMRFRRDEDSLLHDTPPRHILPQDATLDFQNWTGRRLGNYHLKSVISAGGMGVVFLAEQQSPQRDVAVKVLYRGLLIGSARKRFEVEAEILGRLHHPNIAKIYEAGRALLTPAPDDGPSAPMHFFAMEYVAGGATLMEFIRHHKLDLRSRLQLFVQICHGVAYGHQQGIIHRDLKPSNILVTDHGDAKRSAPIPRIIDFGVAKCTDGDIAVSTMQTSAGDLIGTLQYMSPEQCGADALAIDTRSDVYSLGVILYEMLTERVPYDVSNCTIQSAMRIISDTPPIVASQFNRKCRGDLDVILSTALDKSRQRRYASVANLNDDIERYLRGEPIEARPPTRWERSMRWVTRHPRWTAAVISVFISLSIIFGLTGLSIWVTNVRPHRLELTDRGQPHDAARGTRNIYGDRATLYSFAGGVLHSWETPSGDRGIRLANMLERPSRWGGGKVIALSCNPHPNPELTGKLCLYDANSPERLIWSRGMDDAALAAMPDEAWPRPNDDLDRKYHSEGFKVHYSYVADIFEDDKHPGEEIVIYQQFERGTQGALDIYNLNGDLLFRAWQDGGVKEFYWMKQAKLLVCVAIKGDMYDHEYGWDTKGNHPQIVFAIKPEPNEITSAWIHPFRPGRFPRFENDPWNADWYDTEWYAMPCPPEWALTNVAQIYLRPAHDSRFPSSTHVNVSFDFHQMGIEDMSTYNISVVVDRHGNIVDRPSVNNWVLNATTKDPTLPSPDQIELQPWTTSKIPCAITPSQPNLKKGTAR